MPLGSTRMPPKTPAAATIEPTERSMPAVAMTNVMPIASTPTTLACVSMLRTLSQVGNVSGLRIAPATNSSDDDDARARTPGARGRAAAGSGPAVGVGGHCDLLGQDGGIDGRDGVAQQLLLGRRGAVDLGDDLALAHDEDARADADQLLELGRDRRARRARALREVGDQPVDLGLGRDVDAARGLVEQQHAALAQQPAREHDLLLVAARQQAHERGRRRRGPC